MNKQYNVLTQQIFATENYSIIPIRFEDRLEIMKWRNQQIYHLRQREPLTQESQTRYFETTVQDLFTADQPNQILFSYIEGTTCIGYGGIVHINWNDKNAEISFIMNTELEEDFFEFHWHKFLGLIEEVAFNELKLHKLFVYAFDLRPHLYPTLQKSNYFLEATLKEHCIFNGEFKDVIIHAKFNPQEDNN